mmetsp:Transcript_3458/g.5188  ORF Transcript_3458/g.5188 Transcript_3458/m.5188 type:complete len:160 (-) Transcript_3458:301-780(-)
MNTEPANGAASSLTAPVPKVSNSNEPFDLWKSTVEEEKALPSDEIERASPSDEIEEVKMSEAQIANCEESESSLIVLLNKEARDSFEHMPLLYNDDLEFQYSDKNIVTPQPGGSNRESDLSKPPTPSFANDSRDSERVQRLSNLRASHALKKEHENMQT